MSPRLHCVVVTHKRPDGLAAVVESLGAQTRVPDTLVLVDNENAPHVDLVARDHRARGHDTIVLRPGDNTGPAGGTALAMRWLLDNGADDDDWIARLDDDRPAPRPDLLAELERFGTEQRTLDPSVGAVGVVGSRYDWDRARLVRVGDDELVGPVDVDYVATGCFPAFSVDAVREVGTLDPELFHGSTEVEYGLRLRSAGRRIVAHGRLWRELGRATADTAGPRARLGPWNWRRYYSLRNQIHMLRNAGRTDVAIKVIAIRAIGKPAVNFFRSPRLASQHLRWNLRAVRDGWCHRLGRTVEPDEH